MSNTSRDANFEIVHGDQLKLIVIILVLHSWNSKILVPRWKDMESLAVWSSFNDTRPARWFGTFCIFPFSWEFKNPNWRTHIFQRGRLNYQLVILSVLSCLPERPTYFVRMFECCSGAGGQKKNDLYRVEDSEEWYSHMYSLVSSTVFNWKSPNWMEVFIGKPPISTVHFPASRVWFPEGIADSLVNDVAVKSMGKLALSPEMSLVFFLNPVPRNLSISDPGFPSWDQREAVLTSVNHRN